MKMNIVYWLTFTFLILVVAFVFYFNLPKTKKPIDQYTNFILNESKYPIAFTAAPEGNNFLNYYVDPATGGLTMKSEPFPSDTDGLPYKAKSHGKISYQENGFTIEGISTPFTCPDTFRWNQKTKSCELVPLCNNTDVAGTIKGISHYYFDALGIAEKEIAGDENTKGAEAAITAVSDIYHDRLYVMCYQRENSFIIGECIANRVYNQKAENPAGSDPCVYYDICSDNANGFRHRQRTNINAPIQDKGYYICESGVSKLYVCKDNQVFDSVVNTCHERGPCFDQPDGTTLADTPNSYIFCQYDQSYAVPCQWGVYKNSKNNKFVCITSSFCQQPDYSKYFTNQYVSEPYGVMTCTDNVPFEHVIDSKPYTYNVTLAPNSIVKSPKTLFFNETIQLPAQRLLIEYSSNRSSPNATTPDLNTPKPPSNPITINTVPVQVLDITTIADAQWENHLYSSGMPISLLPSSLVLFLSYNKVVLKYESTAAKGYTTLGNALEYEPFYTSHQEPKKFMTNATPRIKLDNCDWVLVSSILMADKELVNEADPPQLLTDGQKYTDPVQVVLPMLQTLYLHPHFPLAITKSNKDTSRNLWLVQLNINLFLTYSIPADATGPLSTEFLHATPAWATNQFDEVHSNCYYATSTNYAGIPIENNYVVQQNKTVVQVISSFTYLEWLLTYQTIKDIQTNVIPVGWSLTRPTYATMVGYPQINFFTGANAHAYAVYEPINIKRPQLFQ